MPLSNSIASLNAKIVSLDTLLLFVIAIVLVTILEVSHSKYKISAS
ncbi:hypothetical protein MPR_1851 [Myroides profundi]|nr:hypothetical protein MPR_1851 [Myroides profundi]